RKRVGGGDPEGPVVIVGKAGRARIRPSNTTRARDVLDPRRITEWVVAFRDVGTARRCAGQIGRLHDGVSHAPGVVVLVRITGPTRRGEAAFDAGDLLVGGKRDQPVCRVVEETPGGRRGDPAVGYWIEASIDRHRGRICVVVNGCGGGRGAERRGPAI